MGLWRRSLCYPARQLRTYQKNQGKVVVFSRTALAIAGLFMALAASAADVFSAPDSSIYGLLGVGLVALVLLRRRSP